MIIGLELEEKKLDDLEIQHNKYIHVIILSQFILLLTESIFNPMRLFLLRNKRHSFEILNVTEICLFSKTYSNDIFWTVSGKKE